MTQFFQHLWPRFVKLCEKNPKMFVEILFWKTSKDAVEIMEGYGTYQSSKKSSNKRSNPKFNWTEVEDNELEVLAEEYLKLPSEGAVLSALMSLPFSSPVVVHVYLSLSLSASFECL